MANYHCTVKMISRTDGKSCVASLAYRSATKLEDRRTSDTWDYTNKGFVNHVEILLPEDAPAWISDIAETCKTSRQTALQKLSDVFEAAEKRKDSQVYREVEFSLPEELTDEQNIKWANEFIRDVCVNKGMVAIMNFHFDIDPETGEEKPHCHALLSTRNLTEDGFSKEKNREWNRDFLIHELRQQYEQHQNLALKEHGFDVRVDHRSYEDRGIEIDPQPKLGKQIAEMTKRGIPREKQSAFDGVRLKNQFKIVRSPEIVFSIVTSNHSTFTEKDIAVVLNRYIDDADQFRILHGRLMGSKELVPLTTKEGSEAVYTTREMLRIEMGLVSKAENLAAQQTHGVDDITVDEVIARQNEKLSAYGGLSTDQEAAIRHMLSPDQLSCVVGFAGAGKTTSLEAAREGWEEAGYSVLGLAPTGKAARNIEGSGIRAMTLHKFLLAQQEGREQVSEKTVLVLDEAGMVDSRRMSELMSIVERAGAKGVAMGDGHQVQAVEAGPAFRLLTDRVKPVVLETVVRQQVDWQRQSTRLFGEGHAKEALSIYQEKGIFKIIPETRLEKGLSDPDRAIDNYCLARQVSGRIWKEIEADTKAMVGDKGMEHPPGKHTPHYAAHQDYKLYQAWKGIRQEMVQKIIDGFAGVEGRPPVDDRLRGEGGLRGELKAKGIDVVRFGSLVEKYRGGQDSALIGIQDTLRKMSYDTIVDTRAEARQELVKAWASDRKAMLDRRPVIGNGVSTDREPGVDKGVDTNRKTAFESHLMLAFTNKDANSLNESARVLMRDAGEIKGADYTVTTQRIDTDDFGKEVTTFHDRTFAQGDRLLFTRNDNRLGVSNGTLGTILEINEQKMTVALDGDDQKTVSFSPNLYPYLDNGWATTIHKAQGVTVDHVKMLASFEQYRNLSYVGMTRHRYTLQVFGSGLDFWREGKVIDRLSRVQEKLSGFDYLDADKIGQVLQEDTTALWHDRKIEEAKDLWSAVKVTAQGLFNQVTGSSQHLNKTKGMGAEGFPSFDHTEEKRSTAFFQDGDGSKENVSQESSLSFSSRLKEDIRTQGESNLASEGVNVSESPEGANPGFQDGLPSAPSPSREPQYPGLQKGSGGIKEADDTIARPIAADGPVPKKVRTEARTMAKNYSPQEQEILAYLTQEVTPTKHTWLKEQFAGKVLGLAKGDPFAALGKWQRVSRDFSFKPSLPDDRMTVNQKEKIMVRQDLPSFKEVEDRLKDRIAELTEDLLGKPTSRSGDKLRFGKRGSVSVFIRGERQGVYTNFESGTKGGPLKLIEEQQGLSSSQEALTWASDWLGGNSVVVERWVVEKPEEGKPSTWTPIIPVPKSAGNPDIEGNKYLNYMLKDGAREVSRHAYRDAQGNLKGYVFRIEKAGGSKITPPLSYCENGRGRQAWKWQGFEKDNKTPYGIEKLSQDQSKPILVVEGEKTADAAQKLLPDYHVLTWSGGAGNVGKTNWNPLIGRNVIIWPDNDQGGHKAAETLQGIIGLVNAEKGKGGSVSIVSLPQTLPHKWDLADTLPEGWTLDTVKEMVKEALSQKETRVFQEKDIDKKQERPAERATVEPVGTTKNYSSQELEVLGYLKGEVTPDKHTWLSESFKNSVFKRAEDDPFAALGKWQRVSRDFSFEPSIPDNEMTPDQKELKKDILGYLQENVHPDPQRRVKQEACQNILEMAGKKPENALHAWQTLTRNYEFNPYLAKLSNREIVVYGYLAEKLSDKSVRITKSILADVSAHLLKNPLKAYEEWHQYSNDQTFDPKTGIPAIEMQARELIHSLKDHLSPDILKAWESKLTQSPETVIQEACEFMKTQQGHEKIDDAVSRFISLSDIHEKLSPTDPKRNQIGEALSHMAKDHSKDQRFMEGIKDSRNDTAIQSLAEEIRMQKQLQQQKELSRGVDMGM